MESPPPPPPSVPAGWMDDPDGSTWLRYWEGAKWTDNRRPKPPDSTPTGSAYPRPDSLWDDKPVPAPTAVAVDGWVDVKISTVPNVVIASTKDNWYRVFVSASQGNLAVTTTSGADVVAYDQGTYNADIAMGFKEVRKTPTWAIVLGIIGTLLFIIGFLFFFVKETRQEESRILTITLNDGRSFSGPYVDGASYK
jgi:hypothetical protein